MSFPIVGVPAPAPAQAVTGTSPGRPLPPAMSSGQPSGPPASQTFPHHLQRERDLQRQIISEYRVRELDFHGTLSLGEQAFLARKSLSPHSMLEGQNGFIHLIEILIGQRCTGFFHHEGGPDGSTSLSLTTRKVNSCLLPVIQRFNLQSVFLADQVDEISINTSAGILPKTWFFANTAHPLWARVQDVLRRGVRGAPQPLHDGPAPTSDPLDRELGPAFEFLPGGQLSYVVVTAANSGNRFQRPCIFDRSLSVDDAFTKLVLVKLTLTTFVPIARTNIPGQPVRLIFPPEQLMMIEIFRGLFAVNIETSLDAFHRAFERYNNMAALIAPSIITADIDWTGEFTLGPNVLPPTEEELRANEMIRELELATRPPTLALGLSMFNKHAYHMAMKGSADGRQVTKEPTDLRGPATPVSLVSSSPQHGGLGAGTNSASGCTDPRYSHSETNIAKGRETMVREDLNGSKQPPVGYTSIPGEFGGASIPSSITNIPPAHPPSGDRYGTTEFPPPVGNGDLSRSLMPRAFNAYNNDRMQSNLPMVPRAEVMEALHEPITSDIVICMAPKKEPADGQPGQSTDPEAPNRVSGNSATGRSQPEQMPR